MLSLMLSLALAFPASAQDKPLRTSTDEMAVLDATPVLDIRAIHLGEPSPVDGRVMDTAAYISLAQRVVKAETERDELMKAPPNASIPIALAALLAGLAMVGGVYLGVRVTNALQGR